MALSAQDRIAILELVATYNQAIDRHDGEAWADTFTSDGVFEYGDFKAEGREQLVKLATRGGNSLTRHWTSNFRFVDGADEDEVTFLAELAALHYNRVVTTGHYVNRVTRTEEGWRFRHRLFEQD